MGYIRHHAIIVTSWEEAKVLKAHKRAEQIGLTCTSIASSPVNGYCTFLVVPDGSKEGWADSDIGEVQRHHFIEWLRGQAYEDGSTPYDWALVQYGDEDGDNRLLADDN